MKSRNNSHILVIIALGIATLFTSSCSQAPEKVIEDSKFFMGTIVQIKVSIDRAKYDETRARAAISKAFDEIKRIEDIYSVYKDTSEISRINRLRKNERLQISDGVFNLIRKTLDYSERTDGAFDITVKPLVDLWRGARQANKLPDQNELGRILERVGYKNVVLDKAARTIQFKKEGMSIDLGGAAKGYATDRAVRILEENGIENAIVNSGGDMYCLGKRTAREFWKVGVQHPRDRNRLFLEIKIKDKAIDTSGDYERYFVLGGKRYSHIINPRTGYPIGDDVVSSSVIAGDSATSDILATAMCILGQKGFDVIKREPGVVDVVLVTEIAGRLTVNMTEGIRKRYDISEEKL
ncbi:MAG: FAD:protein FMN transferase [Candidatus Omnitrophota bacterium]|nr:FAD:protein FMN transferase [Candidatus Omnitrophota bacterium]